MIWQCKDLFWGYEIFPGETINSLRRSKYRPARRKPEKISPLGNVNSLRRTKICVLRDTKVFPLENKNPFR